MHDLISILSNFTKCIRYLTALLLWIYALWLRVKTSLLIDACWPGRRAFYLVHDFIHLVTLHQQQWATHPPHCDNVSFLLYKGWYTKHTCSDWEGGTLHAKISMIPSYISMVTNSFVCIVCVHMYLVHLHCMWPRNSPVERLEVWERHPGGTSSK